METESRRRTTDSDSDLPLICISGDRSRRHDDAFLFLGQSEIILITEQEQVLRYNHVLGSLLSIRFLSQRQRSDAHPSSPGCAIWRPLGHSGAAAIADSLVARPRRDKLSLARFSSSFFSPAREASRAPGRTLLRERGRHQRRTAARRKYEANAREHG